MHITGERDGRPVKVGVAITGKLKSGIWYLSLIVNKLIFLFDTTDLTTGSLESDMN